MEDMIQRAASNLKAEDYAMKPIRTLGEVLLLLKSQPAENIVKLDFTNELPHRLCSYRGYYEDLCLDHDEGRPAMAVQQLLELFEGAVGQTYTAWKGEDFLMSPKTLVWVAREGETGRMLTDIQSEQGITTICTEVDYT